MVCSLLTTYRMISLTRGQLLDEKGKAVREEQVRLDGDSRSSDGRNSRAEITQRLLHI